MSRIQRTSNTVTEISGRFQILVTEHLKWKYSQLSKVLGYANPSTLASVKKGKTLPDFARLAEHYEAIHDQDGRHINIHWLVTGEGVPMINSKNSNNDFDIIINISHLDRQKAQAVLDHLANILRK